MLSYISVKNFAIIENIEVDFKKGMTALTGETGAGKSILMGALGLILGERADSTVLSQKEKKLVVEGVFDSGADQRVHQFLLAQELEGEQELVLRREINPQGKFYDCPFINQAGCSACNNCPHMQLNTLEKLYLVMLNLVIILKENKLHNL